MSYALSGSWRRRGAFGAVSCPEGWTLQDDGSCWAPPGSTCPPGFMGQATTEGQPGVCVPTEPGACKTIGAVFDPLYPSKCKIACTPGTEPNDLGVCMPPVVVAPPPRPVPEPAPAPIPPPIVQAAPKRAAAKPMTPYVILGGAILLGFGLVALAGRSKRKS